MVYLRKAKLAADAPLFPAASGRGVGEPLTRSGLFHLIQRLGKVAGVAVNVHQMRRTFATTILQNGSDIVAVRDMLGHSTIHMTLKYLNVAESHIEAQHRKFSPGDRLKLRK
jgi:integrase/recombinase XerD